MASAALSLVRWNELLVSALFEDEARIDLPIRRIECTPGFLNNEGNFKDKPTFIGGTYGPGPLAYRDVIAEWLDQDFERDTEVLGKA